MTRAAAALFLLLVAAHPSIAADHSGKPGALILTGGGGLPQEAIERALALAGGQSARIAILPQASPHQKDAEISAKAFKAAGARNIRILRFEHDLAEPPLDPSDDRSPGLPTSREAIERADLIWFPGGDQLRLIEALEQSGLAELIRKKHRSGTVVGGSSAGATVISDIMITGDRQSLKSLTSGLTETRQGLGLWQGVIIDQHFLDRRRNNRLLAAVLDDPSHVGIGIDKRTGIIVHGNQFDVVGESAVIVFDARQAWLKPAVAGTPAAAMGVVTHILVRDTGLDLSE